MYLRFPNRGRGTFSCLSVAPRILRSRDIRTSLYSTRKYPKRRTLRMAQTCLRFSALGPSPIYSTFPLRFPAPQKRPGRISLCARSAARMHVKCIREFPASPLCCRSGAGIPARSPDGLTPTSCDGRSRPSLAFAAFAHPAQHSVHAPYGDPTAKPTRAKSCGLGYPNGRPSQLGTMSAVGVGPPMGSSTQEFTSSNRAFARSGTCRGTQKPSNCRMQRAPTIRSAPRWRRR